MRIIRHETLSTLFDLVYVVLATNLMLVVGALPLVVVLLTTDPATSWPLLAVTAPLCAPALCAAFSVLAGFSNGHDTAVVRTFAAAWRACLRRASALGAMSAGAVVVLAVDARAAWGRPVGAVAIPVLVTAIALITATTMLAFVVIAERPTVLLRDALRACLYLALRRWYLTVFSLTMLALLEALVVSRPAIAFGLASSPLLYVVWANSRYTLREALGPITT